ncbi:MAG TPA: hypothetical protein VF681_09315 [Abditibacteriaceae bacterium]|jgi:hypothetical protein
MRKLIVLLCFLLLTTAAHAQLSERWTLGRSLHIDLPGKPGVATLPWSGRDTWLFTANQWRAEGNGLKVEVARFYSTTQSPLQLLETIEATTGAAGERQTGEVSGRTFVVARNAERWIGTIEPTRGVSGSFAWGIVMTGNAALAQQAWDSIEFEHDGSGKTAMRALGPTKLIAELPFELTPSLRSAGNGQRRYDASWDGMSVNVAIDQASGPDMRWDTKSTISTYIDKARKKPNVSGFKAERTGIKFGKLTGDLATLTFKEGTRDYKIWNVSTFSGSEGYSIEFIIDPNRADHILTVGRALETIRTTDISTWGWKSHTLSGITVEAPMAFTQTKNGDDLREWESGATAMPTTVREVVLSPGVFTDPDAAAAQSVQIIKMTGGMTNAQHIGTEKRVVDGLPARLVNFTWKNDTATNLRSYLFIYGATRTWTIDAIAAQNYKDWLARLFDAVRVQTPDSGAAVQRIGGINASFRLGKNPIEATTLPPPAPEIKAITQAIVPLPSGGVLAVIDQTMAQDGQVTKPQALDFYSSFSKVMNAPAPTEVHPITIDGARGFHVRGKGTTNGVAKDTDFLLMARGKSLFVVFMATDPNSPDRALRDEMLNSLRLTSY